MPPADIPTIPSSVGSFEHLYSLKAYDKIPIHEYKSKTTGLTVVLAEIDGPVVNGYFCVLTETFDDDGLPHTLEHLIFLGSEDYPYKGVLDLLANRCLASGTNAWTDTDHTCYTMETAGAEGFLTLMPIYLDHILYPVLSDEGFVTEVHHITPEGDNAGVVYAEMQGRESSAESRLYLSMARNVYPGKCGYSSETGGIMKNLRESCNNTKVRNFHKQYYRPENLKLIITGRVNLEDIFKALEPIEKKILEKGDRGVFVKPWQTPVEPLTESKDLEIKYPSDEEKNGLYCAAWRGPSAVHDQYNLMGAAILMKYLCAFSISPLQKEFVEIPDPFASNVSHQLTENSTSCLYFLFQNVPKEKLSSVKPKLIELFKKIVDNDDMDMDQMKNIILRYKLETLSNLENSPHHSIAFLAIGYTLYCPNNEDLKERINPLKYLEKLLEEPKTYWINLLKQYFVDNVLISIQAEPSIAEQQAMALEEKARVEAQIKQLGQAGLKEVKEKLESAIEFNERPASKDLLTSVKIPSCKSMNFHNIVRYQTDSEDKSKIDLSKTPIFTYFDHVNTNFVYMFVVMNTECLSLDCKLYLPLFLEALFESPVKDGDVIIPFEEVVKDLNNNIVASMGSLGIECLDSGRVSNFKCGSFSNSANVMLQVEASKYPDGINWLRKLLYQTIFTEERLKIIATKMINNVSEAKRHGRNVAAYAMKGLRYFENSNPQANGILKQHTFLMRLMETLNSDKSKEVLDKMEDIRGILSKPSNIVLYCAANLDTLQNAAQEIENIFPKELANTAKSTCLQVLPDHSLLIPDTEETKPSCIIGMGCLESSFLYQTTKCVLSPNDPDIPALLLHIQYLIQLEGPMWKQIRGKGLSYGYTISLKVSEGLLYLVFMKSNNIVAAYKETLDIINKQLKDNDWDQNLIDSAKSSLIFEIIDKEKTIGDAVSLSLKSYFEKIDYKHNRSLLGLIDKVTIDDLNRVGEKYLAPLFDPKQVKSALVCDPSKADEIKQGFEKFSHDLVLYPSLEESFLKD